MKKLFYIFLLLGIVYGQPKLGVFADDASFKSAYIMGEPFEATVYLQNTGDRTFTGDAGVEIRVDYTQTQAYSNLLGIISFNNITLEPKEYIPVDLSVFYISDAIFQEGDDIVIIWPRLAPNSNVGISDTLRHTITVTVQADYTLIQKNYTDKIKIYPNPTRGVMNVINWEEIKSLELYAANGKLVKVLEPGKQIDISDVAGGIYYLWVITKENKKQAIVVRKE